MSNLDRLDKAVRDWATDRNFFGEGGATVLAQHDKLVEECLELRDELILSTLSLSETGAVSAITSLHTKKELGDVLVVCIILAELSNTSVEECLQMAYYKIKDRKGEWRKGKFVKEEDL